MIIRHGFFIYQSCRELHNLPYNRDFQIPKAVQAKSSLPNNSITHKISRIIYKENISTKLHMLLYLVIKRYKAKITPAITYKAKGLLSMSKATEAATKIWTAKETKSAELDRNWLIWKARSIAEARKSCLI